MTMATSHSYSCGASASSLTLLTSYRFLLCGLGLYMCECKCAAVCVLYSALMVWVAFQAGTSNSSCGSTATCLPSHTPSTSKKLPAPCYHSLCIGNNTSAARLMARRAHSLLPWCRHREPGQAQVPVQVQVLIWRILPRPCSVRAPSSIIGAFVDHCHSMSAVWCAVARLTIASPGQSHLRREHGCGSGPCSLDVCPASCCRRQGTHACWRATAGDGAVLTP